MSHLDEARYGRACFLVLNVCPFTLRQVIDDYYTRHGYSTLQDFLDNNKHALFHLSYKRCCCTFISSRTPMYKSQWDELYIKNMLPCSTGHHRGDCPCQYNTKPGITSNEMDITLCCLIITNICSGPPGINKTHIKTIREIRNKLIHGSSASLDEITFKDYWKKVETALFDLATNVSSIALADTQKMVDELKTRMMDPGELGELRKLVLDQTKFAELEVRVSEAESDHGKTSKQVAQMEGRVTRAATKLDNLEETVKQTEGASQKIPGLETKVEQAKRKIAGLEEIVGEQVETIEQMRKKLRTDDLSDGGQDISKLKQRLMEINTDTTIEIPISPLQKRGKYKMPIELLFAPVVIREEQTEQENGGNSQSDSYFSTDADTDRSLSNESFSEVVDSDMSDDSDTSSQQDRAIEDPADIFKKDGKVARSIYMLGDAARGKTTYCMWLLKKWCNAQSVDGVGSKELDKWENVMQRFEFVFLVQFRHVNPGRASVIDMISQDVFARDTDYHTAIRHVLSSDKYRSLIIMDGLDEWNPNEETKRQLTYQRMPNIEGMSSSVSCFFSMRPWVFSAISKIVGLTDRVIEILGLSKTGMRDVIRNVLLNYYNLRENSSQFRATYDKIIRHLKERSLKSFMQIPLLAVVYVQIWYKGEQVEGSMTSFYTSMLNMLIERGQIKHETQQFLDQTMNLSLPKLLSAKKNIKNCIHVLLKLGKVAYDGLLSKHTVFQMEDLEKEIGERELHFALDVGLISQREAPSLLTKNVSVHFFHKSIQEFLAAIYILTQKVSDSFCKHLSNLKVIMELSNVIIFICGMCPSLGGGISRHVVSVTDSDTEICNYRKSPFDYYSTARELYKQQISWYRELKYGQTDSPRTQTESPVTQTDRPVTQTDRPVTQTDSPRTQIDSHLTQTHNLVTFHVSDVYLDEYSDRETVRVTKKLLFDHDVDIRSLWLDCVPTDKERGITNEELCDFLSDTHRTRSLVMLYIKCGNSGRSVSSLCVPTLRFLRLSCVNVCPPLLKDMSQLRDLQLQSVTLGEGGLCLSPYMDHIENVDLIFVNMPAAGWGEFLSSVSNIQHSFTVLLKDGNIDDVSLNNIRSSSDVTVTFDDRNRFDEGFLRFTRLLSPSQVTDYGGICGATF